MSCKPMLLWISDICNHFPPPLWEDSPQHEKATVCRWFFATPQVFLLLVGDSVMSVTGLFRDQVPHLCRCGNVTFGTGVVDGWLILTEEGFNYVLDHLRRK